MTQAKSQNIHECDNFTISRRKCGRGFSYFRLHGDRVGQKQVIKRIKALVIPPMWDDVLISTCQLSKVQAFGFDQRGRKQYIYHDLWHQQQQASKFKKLAAFAKTLPQIRAAVGDYVNEPGWSKNKACALLIVILDQTGMRIGNQQYTQINETYGLSTLRRKHLEQTPDSLFFDYQGKHGKQRRIEIVDDTVRELVVSSALQPGYPLFRYQDAGKWHDVLSDDVNGFLSTLANDDFTSKDFRTWAGTRLAVEHHAAAAKAVAASPQKKFESTLVKQVAAELGNTPAICKDYYIHPTVLRRLCEKYANQHRVPNFRPRTAWLASSLSNSEKFALALLES